jgi:AraC-like DNA-binding protein
LRKQHAPLLVRNWRCAALAGGETMEQRVRAGMSQVHIYVWDRLVLSVGPGRENAPHRHFGAILLLAPDAPMIVEARDASLSTQAALIAPSAWHRVDCRNSRAAILLIGPDHPWFCYVRPLLDGQPIQALDIAHVAPAPAWDELFAGRASCEAALSAALAMLQAFGGVQATPHKLDERIATVVAELHADLAHPPRLAELSRRSGLSAFTLMRKFKRELGVRIGEYVLWRRLMAALVLVDGRSTIAEIAQRTGFYDQAHLTRTVRRMVELAPSLINDMSQTRVHVCRAAASSKESV